jgi:phospholipid/cholesterol/gamma-HCH transport system substrate-binding protein
MRQGGLLLRFLAFVAVAILVWAVLIFSLTDTNFAKKNSYHAMFHDVSGLHAGDRVRAAGVEVGKVTGVDLVGYDVRVTFTMTTTQHLTTSSRATIDYANLLGQRYLALSPGKTTGTVLEGGATIPVTQTKPALNLTDLLNGLQPVFVVLSPDQVNQLASSIVQVLQGEGTATNDLFNQLATITTNLAGHQREIDDLLSNLADLAQTVGAHSEQLDQVITDFSQLTRTLARDRQVIGDSIDNTAQVAAAVSGLFDRSQESLSHDIHGLRKYTGAVASAHKEFGQALANLPDLLAAFARLTSTGSWLQVYVCDLSVRVTGKAPAPGDPSIPLPLPLKFPQGPVGDQSVHTQVCR